MHTHITIFAIELFSLTFGRFLSHYLYKTYLFTNLKPNRHWILCICVLRCKLPIKSTYNPEHVFDKQDCRLLYVRYMNETFTFTFFPPSSSSFSFVKSFRCNFCVDLGQSSFFFNKLRQRRMTHKMMVSTWTSPSPVEYNLAI